MGVESRGWLGVVKREASWSPAFVRPRPLLLRRPCGCLQGQGIEAVAEEKVYGWRSEYTGIREEGRKNMLLIVFPHGLHEEA